MAFKQIMTVAIAVFILLSFSVSASAMETLGFADENKNSSIIGDDDLSPCGQKIAEFKFYLRDGQRCIRDTDCTVIKGGCPLGCKFYVHKSFETILSSRVEEVAELCHSSVCSSVCPGPETWAPAICTENGRCVADN